MQCRRFLRLCANVLPSILILTVSLKPRLKNYSHVQHAIRDVVQITHIYRSLFGQVTSILFYSNMCLGADESEEGDFFYNEEEVLNGVGAENRAALLERYDAMLDDSEQLDLEEVCSPPCCSRLATSE